VRLLARSRFEPASARRIERFIAVPVFLALLALGVSACASPVDDPQGYVVQLLGFIALCFVVSIVGGMLLMRYIFGKLGGVGGAAAVKGGLPGVAVIETIADTGWTVSMPGAGPNAPDYKLGLQVTPAAGGAPYHADIKALIPRIYAPMIVPGRRVGVLIDATDPTKVALDFQHFSPADSAAGAGAGAYAGAQPGAGMSEASAILSGAGSIAGTVMENPGGVTVRFDANGNPVSGVDDMIGAVRSGTMPTIRGKAATILATGTHGTAVITTAQPLGKKVRDVDPSADPSRLDDPVWLFTVEVSLAGLKPFPAMFGHRVPLAKVAQIAPGVQLAVAVDQSNPSQEVAIDWDRSPLGATS
jgi:hypothetical protein